MLVLCCCAVSAQRDMDELRRKATNGDAKAQYELGECYLKGWNGLKENKTEGVRWIRKSADQGDADSQFWLAWIYKDGNGVKRNYAEAAKWFKKSAGQGKTNSMASLAQLYMEGGPGLQRNVTEGIRWYKMGAEKGDKSCMRSLAEIYRWGKKGVAKNPAEAFKWYKQSESWADVGDCYWDGFGVEKDWSTAVSYYKKANDGVENYRYTIQGNKDKMKKLGDCYKYGWGVEKNAREAVRWYKYASEADNDEGTLCLTVCKMTGFGMAKDFSGGIEWLGRLASLSFNHTVNDVAKMLVKYAEAAETPAQQSQFQRELTQLASKNSEAARLVKEVINSIEEKEEPAPSQQAAAASDPAAFATMPVYDSVPQMPSFPGGSSALFNYLSANIKYPLVCEENGIQGRVICSFIVEPDGSLSELKVVKSVHVSLDKEALRLLRSMPSWTPGQKDGAAVRVRYTVPITFRLQ